MSSSPPHLATPPLVTPRLGAASSLLPASPAPFASAASSGSAAPAATLASPPFKVAPINVVTASLFQELCINFIVTFI
jgi:hypothetical protein